jgi:hypothetical protein
MVKGFRTSRDLRNSNSIDRNDLSVISTRIIKLVFKFCQLSGMKSIMEPYNASSLDRRANLSR